jgi:glycerol-3-phosphate dehydrogenase
MIYFEADDGRICLVYDYLGLALVGSTDIPAKDPDKARCEPEEIDYLIESLRGLLPGMTFAREQIAYAYSGVRPLPASDASMPGLISRDHSAPIAEPDHERPFPIVSLIGGKWTTFRGFAEEVADAALARLGKARKVGTRRMAIGGGKDYPADPAARRAWLAEVGARTGIDEVRLEMLLSRYGATAAEIAAWRIGRNDDRLPDSADYSLSEIDWICRKERVARLADVVMRRTTLAIGGSLTRADLTAIADVSAAALGWSAERKLREIDEVIARLWEENRLSLA